MDQSDTVRKQFIFSNISFYFFLRLKENHRGLQRIECCWQADSVPCPPASDQGIVTGQQPDSEAARCFLCNLGCLGICLFWEQGRCELSSPMTGGSWIVDSCHPSLPCKPSLSLTTHTSHAPFCYWSFLKKKKKKKSYSHGISHLLLIPSYQLSQVFIWQVLCFLAGGGAHSCLEHTLWDSCWQNL